MSYFVLKGMKAFVGALGYSTSFSSIGRAMACVLRVIVQVLAGLTLCGHFCHPPLFQVRWSPVTNINWHALVRNPRKAIGHCCLTDVMLKVILNNKQIKN